MRIHDLPAPGFELGGILEDVGRHGADTGSSRRGRRRVRTGVGAVWPRPSAACAARPVNRRRRRRSAFSSAFTRSARRLGRPPPATGQGPLLGSHRALPGASGAATVRVGVVWAPADMGRRSLRRGARSRRPDASMPVASAPSRRSWTATRSVTMHRRRRRQITTARHETGTEAAPANRRGRQIAGCARGPDGTCVRVRSSDCGRQLRHRRRCSIATAAREAIRRACDRPGAASRGRDVSPPPASTTTGGVRN